MDIWTPTGWPPEQEKEDATLPKPNLGSPRGLQRANAGTAGASLAGCLSFPLFGHNRCPSALDVPGLVLPGILAQHHRSSSRPKPGPTQQRLLRIAAGTRTWPRPTRPRNMAVPDQPILSPSPCVYPGLFPLGRSASPTHRNESEMTAKRPASLAPLPASQPIVPPLLVS